MAREKKALAGTEPRIRFNWGYHDGAHDQQRGAPRVYIPGKPQDLTHVSPTFDKYYFEGYQAGAQDARRGQYIENSSVAWARFSGTEEKEAEKQDRMAARFREDASKTENPTSRENRLSLAAKAEFMAQEIRTGPRGGQFTITASGEKHYVGSNPHADEHQTTGRGPWRK